MLSVLLWILAQIWLCVYVRVCWWWWGGGTKSLKVTLSFPYHLKIQMKSMFLMTQNPEATKEKLDKAN